MRRQRRHVVPVGSDADAAYEALQAGDLAQAKAIYEQVLQAEPRNIDALLGLGGDRLQGRPRRGSQPTYYQRVLELEPRNPYAQAGLIAIIGGADPAGKRIPPEDN